MIDLASSWRRDWPVELRRPCAAAVPSPATRNRRDRGLERRFSRTVRCRRTRRGRQAAVEGRGRSALWLMPCRSCLGRRKGVGDLRLVKMGQNRAREISQKCARSRKEGWDVGGSAEITVFAGNERSRRRQWRASATQRGQPGGSSVKVFEGKERGARGLHIGGVWGS